MSSAHISVLRKIFLGYLAFLFLAYPSSAQQSYRTQQSLKTSSAGRGSASVNPAAVKSMAKSAAAMPLRFMGWKDAAKRGPDVLQHFQRMIRQPFQGPRDQSTAENSVPGAIPSPANLPGMLVRPSLPAGLIPTAVATGDFNGDGKLDWAVANGGENTVYIYLGNGDGTAKPPAILHLAGESPVSIAVADMDGDGNLDIVLAEADSATVGILYGNGDGTFQPEILAGILSVIPTAIVVADVNGDGKPDIIVGVEGSDTTIPSGVFFPLINTGKGRGKFTVGQYSPGYTQDELPSQPD